MGLLDGGMAAVFSSAFSGIYLDATLHRATLADDGAGGGSSSFADEPVKAQIDETTQGQQRSVGYTDTDQRILVLAQDVALINTDAEITMNEGKYAGVRWAIRSSKLDPAQSHYDLRGSQA